MSGNEILILLVWFLCMINIIQMAITVFIVSCGYSVNVNMKRETCSWNKFDEIKWFGVI
jgi:hypothetical protein